MTQDVATMTMEQLKAALAAMRAEQKAKVKEATEFPRFAFLLVTKDSTLTYWQGRATDYKTARQSALDSEPEVFYGPEGVPAICDRPLPNPKGRKLGSTLAKKDAPADDAPEQ